MRLSRRLIQKLPMLSRKTDETAGTSALKTYIAPRLTLRTKLYLVYTVPLLVIVLTSLLFASQRRLKNLQERQLAIADSVIHALSQDLRRIVLFDEQAQWADMGTLLASFPDIEYMVVYDAAGHRLFYYSRPGLPLLRTLPSSQPGATIIQDHLHLVRTLAIPNLETSGSEGSHGVRTEDPGMAGEALARVYLRQDASDLRHQALADRHRILFLALGLATFALLGSWVAHRTLIRPIEGLSDLALQIAETQDYRLRTGLHRTDEVGSLAQGLDHLLERITLELDSRDANARDREQLICELKMRNSELDQFAHSVAHDLRNPLVTIQVFGDRLSEDFALGKTERAQSDLGRILKAAKRMSRLLEDLLELSQISRAVLRSRPVNLNTLLHDLIDQLRNNPEAPEFQITVDKSPTWILADPSRIRRVFLNLLENALKFSSGQPSIEIGFRTDETIIQCHVRDQGLGIDARYHQRIFNLFECLAPEKGGGTGIGLTLAQRITEAHGGRIWVESEGLGHGATFFVTLPRATEPDPPAHSR